MNDKTFNFFFVVLFLLSLVVTGVAIWAAVSLVNWVTSR